ncbi:MAG: hypothetical protein JKY36_05975, partial [Erythrobacter sp.]|nr:hypothetical protein [Erythrobacter sp.]
RQYLLAPGRSAPGEHVGPALKQERRVDEGLVVQVENVADARLGLAARFVAHPKIEDEARIMRGEATELGRRHIVNAKKLLDAADQHVCAPHGCIRSGESLALFLIRSSRNPRRYYTKDTHVVFGVDK